MFFSFIKIQTDYFHIWPNYNEIINIFLNKANYLVRLEKEENFKDRKENLDELISFASTIPNVSEFLEKISLTQSTDIPVGEDAGNLREAELCK